MLACQHGCGAGAGMMMCCQLGAPHERGLPAKPVPLLADGSGGGMSHLERRPFLGHRSFLLNNGAREGCRITCAAEAASSGARELTAYEKMLRDQEEKKRERTGVYREPPDVQPLSAEDAQHLLALDRPDLSAPVEFPLEWRLSRRETPSNPHIDEMSGEQGAEEVVPLNRLPSNANRLRSVEERCKLRVRRNISQAELSAMGVAEWPEYSWSQPVELGLVYDRVPEACYIEHGRVRLRSPQAEENDFCELAAGDFVRFPKYSSFLWEIVEAPLVRRYKFLIDLPPPPDPAEVLRLRLHEKKMQEQQLRAEVRYKKKPMKGREKQMRVAEAEMRKELMDLRTGADRSSD